MRQAGIAKLALLSPGLAQDLDTETLMVGIVAGKVAIRLEAHCGVAALKEELFPVTHCVDKSCTGLLRNNSWLPDNVKCMSRR